MPTVEVPSRYRLPTKGQARIEVSAGSIRGCIEEIEERHPGFQKLILDSKGNLNRFVTLFVNKVAVPRGEIDASLAPDDSLEIVAAAAGG